MGVVVASVPANHVYVRHLSVPGDGVHRLPDPRPRADVPDAQWWPPRMLEPGWIREHADDFDVLHVHFGFDALAPEQLHDVVASLRAAGRPLVVTVHDLRNPHHPERGLHDEQLSVLVLAADALITLTPGAAEEIARRWGRDALVLPHPHVVDEPLLSRPRPDHQGFVVGVHAKSLRANMDPLVVVDAVVDVLADMPGARLRVDAHTDVMTAGFDRHDAAFSAHLRDLEHEGRIDLHVHDYFSDDELWDYLQGIDVSVLPYLFGTHSGWLEACYDLGTVVVAPDCGYYAEQRPCLTYTAEGTRTQRTASLQQSVLSAYGDRPGWRADPAARREERRMLAGEHAAVYDRVLGRPGSPS